MLDDIRNEDEWEWDDEGQVSAYPKVYIVTETIARGICRICGYETDFLRTELEAGRLLTTHVNDNHLGVATK